MDIAISDYYAELNPICHLQALLGAHHILHVSGLRVTLTQRNQKTKKVQRPGDRGQQGVESEDKSCASYIWSIRKN